MKTPFKLKKSTFYKKSPIRHPHKDWLRRQEHEHMDISIDGKKRKAKKRNV